MSTSIVDAAELRDHVREMYREVANEPGGDFHFETGRALAERLGYPADWLDAVPADALASFAGVGHLLDLAAIAPGEARARPRLGLRHRLVHRRRAHRPRRARARRRHDRRPAGQGAPLRDFAGLGHVAFLNGLIEEPPVVPGGVDVVISNGVINLAPDKAARVPLRPRAPCARAGGSRIADIVAERELIKRTRRNVALWAACIAGAVPHADYLGAIEAAGLRVQTVRPNPATASSRRAPRRPRTSTA